MANLSNTTIPRNIHKAFESNEWKKIVQEEMTTLTKNNIWNLVLRPKDKRTVKCKWIFTIKYKADGSVDKYKTYRVAYLETFTLVPKLNTIRIFLSFL